MTNDPIETRYSREEKYDSMTHFSGTFDHCMSFECETFAVWLILVESCRLSPGQESDLAIREKEMTKMEAASA